MKTNCLHVRHFSAQVESTGGEIDGIFLLQNEDSCLRLGPPNVRQQEVITVF